MTTHEGTSESVGALEPRFVLYGSPHSLPTYKVALMLRLCGEPFSFRYVSFQRGMHKRPEFLAMSRWGQVPVLVDRGEVHVQSAAIVEHLADVLDRFRGRDDRERRAIREWVFWDVDVLFPPIFACYGVRLGERGLLPISVDPTIAAYHREKAETALSKLEPYVTAGAFLCGEEPTIADLLCYGDVAFAEICGFDLARWPAIKRWAGALTALDGFAAPFDLLEMRDLQVS